MFRIDCPSIISEEHVTQAVELLIKQQSYIWLGIYGIKNKVTQEYKDTINNRYKPGMIA